MASLLLMKRYNHISFRISLIKGMILSLFLGHLLMIQGYGQCIPDTACKDVLEPGQICPDSLPDGYLDSTYYEVVTIIPPDSADVNGQMIELYKIVLDTVTNLPPGITYIVADTVLYPDSIYCIELTGQPTTEGIFYLKITVIPYVYSPVLQMEVAFPPQTDSTSLFITVHATAAAPLTGEKRFTPLLPEPNPFTGQTRLGFSQSVPGGAILSIFNLLGEQVYSEIKEGTVGENWFRFNGRAVSPGIYIYHIRKGDEAFTGKLIRMR